MRDFLNAQLVDLDLLELDLYFQVFDIGLKWFTMVKNATFSCICIVLSAEVFPRVSYLILVMGRSTKSFLAFC